MTQEQDAGRGALIDRLATATLGYPEYRYRLRGWGEWIALDGLLAAAETTGNQRYLGFVEGLLAGWIDPTRRLGPADRLAPAGVLLRLHEFRADPDLVSIAQRVASLLVQHDGRK